MEPKHKRSSFGLYEIAPLKENPYTYEVRARQISFTEVRGGSLVCPVPGITAG